MKPIDQLSFQEKEVLKRALSDIDFMENLLRIIFFSPSLSLKNIEEDKVIEVNQLPLLCFDFFAYSKTKTLYAFLLLEDGMQVSEKEAKRMIYYLHYLFDNQVKEIYLLLFEKGKKEDKLSYYPVIETLDLCQFVEIIDTGIRYIRLRKSEKEFPLELESILSDMSEENPCEIKHAWIKEKLEWIKWEYRRKCK